MTFVEEIMFKDKYPSIFLRQMEGIKFIILQTFFAARAVLKIGEYSWIFPRYLVTWLDVFRPIVLQRKYIRWIANLPISEQKLNEFQEATKVDLTPQRVAQLTPARMT